MYYRFSPALGFTLAVIDEAERKDFSEFTTERLQNILCHYLKKIQDFEYEYRALCVTNDNKYIYAWVNEPDAELAEEKLEELFKYAQKVYPQWKQVWVYRNKKEG